MTLNTDVTTHEDDFEEFIGVARVRLRRAFVGAVGIDRAEDAVAEALGWAFEHRSELITMENPIGYLYRVGQSKTRRSKPVTDRLRLVRIEASRIPEVEPGLVDALAALPESQRIAVWLAHGCAWTHSEIGDVLGIAASTVATHVRRGLDNLRREMGVN